MIDIRNLRNERLSRGLTQPELAREAGVSSGTISNLETGRYTPDAKTIRKVWAALQRYPVLFEMSEAPEPVPAA